MVKFQGRVYLLLTFFVLWTGIIVFYLYQIMVADREEYIQLFSSESWRIGIIPAMRGRILNKEGTPLAWSIRYFSLYYDVPPDSVRLKEDITTIGRVLSRHKHPKYPVLAESSILVKEELSPGEILRLRPYIHTNKRFRIQSSFRRQFATERSEILRLIGLTRMIDNKQIGVSGFERKYNLRLTGQDGKYRVMVDKNNKWIAATWEEIQVPVPGFDVYVPVELK